MRDPDPDKGGPNPTGHPVVWYSRKFLDANTILIYCFAPGTEM